MNLQQQLAPTLLANVTTNYVTTRNQFQAFGEQNDYGIMGSLFFAPTNVDFRPVNGIYPLPPSLGTNPLLAIDRIRNPQSIDRFIGSTKLTWTPTSQLLSRLHGRPRQHGLRAAAVRAAERRARHRAARHGARRSRSCSSTRVVNQDGVATYTWTPLGPFELRTTGGFNYTSQRVHLTNATANGLAPVGELVGAGSVFTAGADATSSCARSASTGSRSSRSATGCS